METKHVLLRRRRPKKTILIILDVWQVSLNSGRLHSNLGRFWISGKSANFISCGIPNLPEQNRHFWPSKRYHLKNFCIYLELKPIELLFFQMIENDFKDLKLTISDSNMQIASKSVFRVCFQSG